MVASCIVVLLLAVPPSSSKVAADQDVREEYQTAEGKVGRDPDANIRLALWCEANGLEAERVKHLALAVLMDPSNATARGLLGLVAYHGRWRRPEEVVTDTSLQAKLAEYNARRAAMPETANAHWTLGTWCEQQGLKAEALAHFTAVTRLDPNRADTWHRLGCHKYEGHWLSDAQIAAERAEANARREADARWGPQLKRWWKDWLANPERRADAEVALTGVLEPRAVRMIRTLFAEGTSEQQSVAVRLLDQIDASDATEELARLSTLGHSLDVRRGAATALTRRDTAEAVAPLIDLMRAPLGVDVCPGRGPNAVAELRVEDERVILRKVYTQQTIRIPGPAISGRYNFGFLSAVMTPPRSSRLASQQLAKDLRTISSRNSARRAVSESARGVLSELTGQDLGPEPESWRRWLADQRGYAYTPASSSPKRVITRVSQHALVQVASPSFHSYCFGEGTPVRTLTGLAPIESLRVGDRVLSENLVTGALDFQPVVVIYHNPPSATLRIRLDHEEIISTPIHRFWRAGKGWALARDLKPGDTLRVLGGVAKVIAVEPDRVQPVFNLELADGHSFFVGDRGALVHDNSKVPPLSEPFDAVHVPAAGLR